MKSGVISGWLCGMCAAITLALGLVCGCSGTGFDFGENTFVAYLADGSVATSRKRGVKPLLDALDGGAGRYAKAKCHDRVVGRAAAFIYARLGVSEVYAPVMAKGAVAILELHGIRAHFDDEVPEIRNRAGDGPCPMEHSVRDIADDDVDAAIAAIRAVFASR